MQPGAVVAERFVVLGLAGKGGMGSVYRARDRQTGAVVALKLLELDVDDGAVRLEKEGAALATLEHSGIVPYVAHGTGEGGAPYLAMAWVDGETLGQRLKRGGITVAQSIDLVHRIADALGHAHARGIVHRDVKPGNVLLAGGRLEEPVLIDFGLVRLRHSHQTRSGIVVGTPSYMAPEQVSCAVDLDARADVFSLGCLLFKCVAGRAPFDGADMIAVLTKILLDDAPRLRDVVPTVRPDLDELVATMLAKDRAARPADGREVARRLAEIRARGSLPGEHEAPRNTAPSLTLSERRLLSLIVADARARAAFTDGGAPGGSLLAEVRTLAAPFEARADVITDGSIVVALSGRGSARELACRAAQCALSLRPIFKGMAMVLATGTGLVTLEGTPREGTLGGDVFLRAAAIVRAAVAKPEHPSHELVAIDHVTAELVDERFEVAFDGNASLLRGARASDDAPRTVLGKTTPFVGRDRELSSLSRIVDVAVEEPRAMVALVTAPAGLGKSRLRAEVLRAALERHPHAEIWSARGDSMTAGSPFGMLAQAIKRAASLREGQEPEARRRALGAFVRARVPARSAERIASFIGEIAGAPLPQDQAPIALREARANPVTMGDQVRRALEELLTGELERRPVIIALEDLHWGDVPTVHALDAALRNLKDLPLVVLAFAREEVLDVFPKLWAERGIEISRLGPVPKKAGERLVRELLADRVSSEDAARIVERAAGNAFFLEEMIRAMASGRGDALPDTVLATVQARLEALEPDLRRTLRAASVFGQTFWADGVSALVGKDARVVGTELDVLVERELVTRSWESRFEGTKQLTFVHAIVREAAYASLTEEDASLGHKLAAEWLVAHGESDAVELAEHFERGGGKRLALGWWKRAAEEAVGGADFDGAIERVRRGIACGAEGEVLSQLLLSSTEAWTWKGQFKRAREDASAALEHATRGTEAWILSAARILSASVHLDDIGEALRWADAIGDAFASSTTRSIPSVLSLVRAADTLMLAGKVAPARRLRTLVEKPALELAERSALVRGQWAATRGLFEMFERSDLGAAADSYREAMAAYEECGDRRAAIRERGNWGYVLMRLGSPDAAEALEQAHVDDLRMGLMYFAAGAAQNLTIVLARAGRIEEAQRYLEKSLAICEAQSAHMMRIWSLVYAADVARFGRDWAGAEARARTAREAATSQVAARMYATACLADALWAQGRLDEARTEAARAMAELDGDELIDEGEELTRLVFARVAMSAGDRETAVSAIRKAREVVLARASKIRDEAWRTSFLERIPEHAEILALARAWTDD